MGSLGNIKTLFHSQQGEAGLTGNLRKKPVQAAIWKSPRLKFWQGRVRLCFGARTLQRVSVVSVYRETQTECLTKGDIPVHSCEQSTINFGNSGTLYMELGAAVL